MGPGARDNRDRVDVTPPSGADAARPVFLERAGYRQRRLRDALRLLPVLGGVLWLLPLFRSAPQEAQRETGPVLVYCFVVWSLLIVMARVMAARLRFDSAEDDDNAGPTA